MENLTLPLDLLPNTPDNQSPRLYSEGDAIWAFNDSGIQNYSRKAGIDLQAMIVGQIGKSTSNVAIDIAGGSNGVAIKDLLKEGVIGKGLVTNFEDLRSYRARQNPNLDHVEGDLTFTETWQKIIDWTATASPEGANLVMHRPMGGLQSLDLETYRNCVEIIISILAPGGMFFTQIPRAVVFAGRRKAELCQEVKSNPKVKEIYTPPRTLTSGEYAIIFAN